MLFGLVCWAEQAAWLGRLVSAGREGDALLDWWSYWFGKHLHIVGNDLGRRAEKVGPTILGRAVWIWGRPFLSSEVSCIFCWAVKMGIHQFSLICFEI